MIVFQLTQIINWKKSHNIGLFRNYNVALAYMNKHANKTFELISIPSKDVRYDQFIDEIALEH